MPKHAVLLISRSTSLLPRMSLTPLMRLPSRTRTLWNRPRLILLYQRIPSQKKLRLRKNAPLVGMKLELIAC